ncbi:hypothetical protein CSX04_01451 [Burkholderia cepacia]|nr:hypothetical protein CSX04_01451 [Burkholderia cepacia]
MSSRLSWLSTNGNVDVFAFGSPVWIRRGPNEPRCSHTDAEPGPPLYRKVTGRFAAGWLSAV